MALLTRTGHRPVLMKSSGGSAQAQRMVTITGIIDRTATLA